MGGLHCADPASLHKLHGGSQSGVRAGLESALANAPVPPRRQHHAPPLHDAVADRRFDIHVFAGLHGPDRRHAMPVVGRGDRDDVHTRIVQHPAQVRFPARRGTALAPSHLLGPLPPHLLVHIAHRQDLRVGPSGEEAKMAVAPATHADDRHSQSLLQAAAAWRRSGQQLVHSADRARGGGRGQHGLLQELSAIARLHQRADCWGFGGRGPLDQQATTDPSYTTGSGWA